MGAEKGDRVAELEAALAEALYWLPATVVLDGAKQSALSPEWTHMRAREVRERIELETGIKGDD